MIVRQVLGVLGCGPTPNADAAAARLLRAGRQRPRHGPMVGDGMTAWRSPYFGISWRCCAARYRVRGTPCGSDAA